MSRAHMRRIATRIRAFFPAAIRRTLPREVGVFEITLSESLRLNRHYRKKRKPANVLSFRYSERYGEILVCPEVIRREARVMGHSYDIHMTWMIVHGMLHVAGVHHEKSRVAAERTDRLEKRTLKQLMVH